MWASTISPQSSARFARMMLYGFLARHRQQELLREAEKVRLNKTFSDARRRHPARPEPKREFMEHRA
jgi:hypothetical protein